ncbi:conserved hypothetical protein (plasmid) [Cupriavidus metallidurans CH34]|uniref:Uncharacterized protein n=1 Tax=Cupriavidus metallidurans (strain ATCC 43123 / DSM 2839 / NBRC 102507 / CH34) TaxID=266264 RepID=Q1LAF0_CUPMC|nr:conserved hypothetical protein [Cupriavidus metallidurans CH34]
MPLPCTKTTWSTIVRKILILAVQLAGVLLCGQVFGASIDETVGMVAQTRQTTVATINGRDAEIIYVGRFGDCDSVAVRSGKHYQHFRVCSGKVQARNTVAPSWADDQGSQRVLAAVVRNAIFYGQSAQVDENGYLITARTLGAVEASCKNVEVVISYDGDLVDRGLKRICG